MTWVIPFQGFKLTLGFIPMHDSSKRPRVDDKAVELQVRNVQARRRVERLRNEVGTLAGDVDVAYELQRTRATPEQTPSWKEELRTAR